MYIPKNPLHRIVDTLPLHKNQNPIWEAVFSNKHRFFVINAGRRFGKSTVCLAIAIELAVNYGMKVWWVGKTYRDAGKQWRDAKTILKGIYTSKAEQDRRMEFRYTLSDGTELLGEITFRSADKPDNLRGDGLHLLIVDEAAFQDQMVWTVLRPALADFQGMCIFISTPNGHNWFYTFFQRGDGEAAKARYPGWWSKHYTSYDNPTIPAGEIDSAKNDMTETEFRIEHLAEFIDDIGKVFSNVRKNATAQYSDNPDKSHAYSMGIDLARKHDSTVISIMDMFTNEQVKVVRFNNIDWDLQKAQMAGLIRAWQPRMIYADATAVGQPIVEDLQKLVPEYTITPFIMGSNTKPHLIQQLAVKLQNSLIKILTEETKIGRIQVEELLAYEVKKSKNELRWVYSAPKGGHDDTVIALALSCLALEGRVKEVQVRENPFFPTIRPRADSNIPRNGLMSEYARKSQELQRQMLKEAGLL